MSITRRIAKSLKSFAANQNGTTSIFFALSAIPLFVAAGAAIDVARYNDAQMEVQTALDTAALAGASILGASDTERQNVATETFKQNIDPLLEYKTKFEVKDGFFSARAEADMPTSFMAVVGYKSMAVSADTEVNLLGTKKAEIALVLDYSGSMNATVGTEQKYVVMQRAAKRLIDDLQKLEASKFKVGLVPFSHHVYVTLPSGYVVGAGSSNWTGCTVDRMGPYNMTNNVPETTDDATKWGQKFATAYPDNPGRLTEMLKYDCDGPSGNDGYAKKGLKVRPISKDLKGVKDQLDVMRPYAYTHISLGVEFGYQMLTKGGALGGDVAEFGDEEVEKYIVVLTDGSQTAPAYDRTTNNLGEGSVQQGFDNLAGLCANAKKDGINLVTMAFALTDNDPKLEAQTKQRLRDCASRPELYFDAADGDDITDAFKTITQEITQNIFISR
jgi:Flp pilus assembly protein TadG